MGLCDLRSTMDSTELGKNFCYIKRLRFGIYFMGVG